MFHDDGGESLTLISTQGMALAATECRREGVGVGGAGVGGQEGTSPPVRDSAPESLSITVAIFSQLLDLTTPTPACLLFFRDRGVCLDVSLSCLLSLTLPKTGSM